MKNRENSDLREEMQKYDISCTDLLKYIPNFSHVTRIYEELKNPLTDERKKVYLLAIKKVREERIRMLES